MSETTAGEIVLVVDDRVDRAGVAAAAGRMRSTVVRRLSTLASF